MRAGQGCHNFENPSSYLALNILTSNCYSNAPRQSKSSPALLQRANIDQFKVTMILFSASYILHINCESELLYHLAIDVEDEDWI